MDPVLVAAIALPTAVVSWLATGALARVLSGRGILDRPNQRSSHERPTPPGGGIAVVGVTLLAWAALAGLGYAAWSVIGPIMALAFGLALVSWADDLRNLPPLPRLAAQAGAVVIALTTVPFDQTYAALVPPAWALPFAALAWLWFINLFNFMDGIDGLAGTETVSVALGIGAVAMVAGLADGTPALSIALGAAAAGFLILNWHPARIFLGDVGSVPIGFLLGWFLLSLAAAGHWVAALVLPAYFLADASLTLARRLVRGERVWQAHREHFYQRAVQAGASHAAVTRTVAIANLGLIGCALLSLAGTAALIGAALAALVIVVGLLWYLHRGLSFAGAG
jgi:UDP-N-acetylmuramyl pentapeptide phosphotransferase/UDP-N-acetylglucosamine-1-phosphate transferase